MNNLVWWKVSLPMAKGFVTRWTLRSVPIQNILGKTLIMLYSMPHFWLILDSKHSQILPALCFWACTKGPILYTNILTFVCIYIHMHVCIFFYENVRTWINNADIRSDTYVKIMNSIARSTLDQSLHSLRTSLFEKSWPGNLTTKRSSNL